MYTHNLCMQESLESHGNARVWWLSGRQRARIMVSFHFKSVFFRSHCTYIYTRCEAFSLSPLTFTFTNSSLPVQSLAVNFLSTHCPYSMYSHARFLLLLLLLIYYSAEVAPVQSQCKLLSPSEDCQPVTADVTATPSQVDWTETHQYQKKLCKSFTDHVVYAC